MAKVKLSVPHLIVYHIRPIASDVVVPTHNVAEPPVTHIVTWRVDAL